MTQSAMSLTSDLKQQPLSDFQSDEWGLFLDEFNNGKVNGPLSKLSTREIVKQTLHDIEDLGRKCDDYWLDEFRLFEETQFLEAAEDFLQDYQLIEEESNQIPISPNESIVPENQDQPLNENPYPISYEDAAFILSNEDLFYYETQPGTDICSITGSKPHEERKELKIENIFNSEDTGRYKNCQPSPLNEDVTVKMEIINEIIWNKAQELDQWESYTYQSEKSSDSSSTPKLSSEEKENETDDPEWSPKSLVRKRYRRRSSEFSRRGGSLEDKKLRKKEQNKYAATRYRLKKKAELFNILKEEEILREKKSKLEGRVVDIQNEIRCLKGLMRELFKAKGMIN